MFKMTFILNIKSVYNIELVAALEATGISLDGASFAYS